MKTDFDIYVSFRKAQALANDRPYRLPKDWEAHREKKMTDKNLEFLDEAVKHFNTTFFNIDVDVYMECGFEIWKNFTYKHFLDPRVMEHYIQKDKTRKRKMNGEEDQIVNSFEFIGQFTKQYPPNETYTKLHLFCKTKHGGLRQIVSKYVEGKVDQMTLVYCLWKGYIVLNDDERPLVPYITQRYRELVENLQPLVKFIQMQEESIENV